MSHVASPALFSSPQPSPDLFRWIARQAYSQVLVLCDTQTRKVCWPALKPWLEEQGLAAKQITVPAGELHKNLDTTQQVWQALGRYKADRRSLLLVLGGGALCDLGAFAASTWMRGMPLVLVPTTLLAMADAAIGGKTGIDYQDQKNRIGTFYPAAAVGIYPSLASTLPAREFRSGFVEVVKHTLLGWAEGWHRLRKQEPEEANLAELLDFSVRYKQSIVAEDPTELGKRQILNLGHTAGHALEAHFLKAGQPIPHGEAVAAGLVVESWLAWQKGLLPEADWLGIEEYFLATYGLLPLRKAELPGLVKWAQGDKKNEGGRLKLALLAGIAQPRWGVEVEPKELLVAFRNYAGV